MLSVSQALKALACEQIAAPTGDQSPQLMPTDQSLGHVLAQNITAERDGPPFHRVMMDGISLHSSQRDQLMGGLLPICGVQRAGEKSLPAVRQEAVEIMTGAVLPAQHNCVVPYESLHLTNTDDGKRYAQLRRDHDSQIVPYQNIHLKGQDYKEGQILLRPNTPITAPVIGHIVSQGLAEVQCLRRPRIAVISTGDELVELGQPTLQDFQIRSSNSHALKALLKQFFPSIEVETFHLPDRPQKIIHKLGELLQTHQVLILSGGVSKGKSDYIPSVLHDLQVQQIFHRVLQKPGKPLYFGKAPNHTLVFGLPGNPVSAMVCARRYIVEFLASPAPSPPLVPLSRPINFSKNLTYFPLVSLTRQDNRPLEAQAIPNNGSGDFHSMALSDGFIQLPPRPHHFPAGEMAPFYSWTQL